MNPFRWSVAIYLSFMDPQLLSPLKLSGLPMRINYADVIIFHHLTDCSEVDGGAR